MTTMQNKTHYNKEELKKSLMTFSEDKGVDKLQALRLFNLVEPVISENQKLSVIHHDVVSEQIRILPSNLQFKDDDKSLLEQLLNNDKTVVMDLLLKNPLWSQMMINYLTSNGVDTPQFSIFENVFCQSVSFKNEHQLLRILMLQDTILVYRFVPDKSYIMMHSNVLSIGNFCHIDFKQEHQDVVLNNFISSSGENQSYWAYKALEAYCANKRLFKNGVEFLDDLESQMLSLKQTCHGVRLKINNGPIWDSFLDCMQHIVDLHDIVSERCSVKDGVKRNRRSPILNIKTK